MNLFNTPIHGVCRNFLQNKTLKFGKIKILVNFGGNLRQFHSENCKKNSSQKPSGQRIHSVLTFCNIIHGVYQNFDNTCITTLKTKVFGFYVVFGVKLRNSNYLFKVNYWTVGLRLVERFQHSSARYPTKN